MVLIVINNARFFLENLFGKIRGENEILDPSPTKTYIYIKKKRKTKVHARLNKSN